MRSFKNSVCVIAAVILLNVVSRVDAAPFAIEARSMGMGNISVATANIVTAAFSNPAMLANQRENDDFALLIGLGGFLNDDDNVLDDVDDFQSGKRKLLGGDIQGLIDMVDAVTRVNGKVIEPELAAVFVFGFTGETYSFALSARGDLVSAGTLSNFDDSLAGLLDPTKNLLSFEGVLATTIGFSIARDFEIMGRDLSIGIKPKIVQFEAVFFEESILTIGDRLKDFDLDDIKVELDDVTTLDLGFALDLTDTWRIGLVIKNLITDEFQVASNTFELDTEYRAGIAYHTNFMVLGLDVDLIENDPLLSSPNFDGLKTRLVAVGAEFNAFDYVQLRLGASQNIASGVPSEAKDTTYYAGLGIWLGFNLDLAVASRDESLGAFLQTGFSF